MRPRAGIENRVVGLRPLVNFIIKKAMASPSTTAPMSVSADASAGAVGAEPLPQVAATSLAGLAVGARAIVRRLAIERPVARRLMELGLLPGTVVEVARIAPLGDPIEIGLRGYRLSIRRSEAARIDVAPAGEGR